MTFHFFDRARSFPAYPAGQSAFRARRARLIARWHRGSDGKLECRWESRSYT